MKETDLYVYKAYVLSVYDGDTIRVDVDLGFGVWLKNQQLRFLDINAPEVRGEERPKGLKSRDWLRAEIDGKEVLIHTKKGKEKYGRWLATVFHNDVNINERMVELELAVPAQY